MATEYKLSYTASEIDERLAMVSQLSSEKVDKTGVSLGIASDGLIYLFIDGSPVGTGIPQGTSGDVFGYVDENNTVVLTGTLANGTYTIKYEMSNGEVVDIGDMVLDTNVYYSVTSNLTKCSTSNSTNTVVAGGSYTTVISANSGYDITSVVVTMGGTNITSSAYSNGTVTIASVTGAIVITAVAEATVVEPSYTNVLPLAIDASGNDYVGTNGEDGYKTGYKISTSSGNESSADACVSGFIKLAEGVQSKIRIKNITLSSSASINNFVFYNANKERVSGYVGAGVAGAFHSDVDVADGVYLFSTSKWFTVDNLPAYFRFSCGEITDETIVTINEEIS